MGGTKLKCLAVLGTMLLGCEDFLPDACPDSQGPESKNICSCQAHQYSMEGHGCCFTRPRGQCAAEPSHPPECSADVTVPPRVVVPLPLTAVTLAGSSVDIQLCEPMKFQWVYGNGMAGTMAPPDGIRVAIPQLRVSEPGAVNSEVKVFQKPWPSLEPCAVSAQQEVFNEGLFPDWETRVTPATFVAEVALLPTSVPREMVLTSVRAEVPEDISECL